VSGFQLSVLYPCSVHNLVSCETYIERNCFLNGNSQAFLHTGMPIPSMADGFK